MTIQLFNIPKYKIDCKKCNNVLHDGVEDFEAAFAEYVGAKYACGVNSATNAIQLTLTKYKDQNPQTSRCDVVSIATMIPPVVLNAIHHAGLKYRFVDDTYWIGASYPLYCGLNNFCIVDSAQETYRNIFPDKCDPQDLMIFSFYPTKPVNGIDGGMVVSDDKEKIEDLRTLVHNGVQRGENSWESEIVERGWKSYLSSAQAFVAHKSLDKLDNKQANIGYNRDWLNNELGYKNTSLHLYIVCLPYRDEFIAWMKEDRGIVCGIHYRCMHNHPVYQGSDDPLQCPISLARSQECVSIPFHEALSKPQLRWVAKSVKKWWKSYGL